MTRKNIGVPVSPPERECQDKRCAWHGSLPVRGRTFQGIVRSSKAKDTVIVEWDYTHFVPKYERYERRKSRVVAHNPDCQKAREGDKVIIAECRPLSKTKTFVVVAVPERKLEQAEFKIAEVEAKAVAEQKRAKEESPKETEREAPKKERPKQEKHEKPRKKKTKNKPKKK